MASRRRGRAAPGQAASPEEQKQLPEVLATFKEYLRGHLQTRVSVSTYYTSMCWISRTFGRSFEYMAQSGDELICHIRDSVEDKRRSKISSATLKMFGRFWAERHQKGRKRKAVRLEAVTMHENGAILLTPKAGKEAPSKSRQGRKRKARVAATTAKARRRQSPASLGMTALAASVADRRARRRRQRRADAAASARKVASSGGAAVEASSSKPSATLLGMWPRRPAASASAGTSEATSAEDAATAAVVPGRRATQAEEEEFPAVSEQFDQYLKRQFKFATAEVYKSAFTNLWNEFHKAPTVMANSVNFLRFVVQWPKNKRGNSQYSSALKAFRAFWASNQKGDLKARLLSSAAPAAASEPPAAPDGAPGRLATEPEDEEFPALLERFGQYLSRQHKVGTAKVYKTNFAALFAEFHRAPSVMANSVAFLRHVEQMPKNKRTNSQFSASLKAFRAFWASEKGGLKGALSSLPRPSCSETPAAAAAVTPERKEGKKDICFVDLLDGPVEQETPSKEPSAKPASKPMPDFFSKKLPKGAAVWDVGSDVSEAGEEEPPPAKAQPAEPDPAEPEPAEPAQVAQPTEAGAEAEGGEAAEDEDEAWAVALDLLSELEAEPWPLEAELEDVDGCCVEEEEALLAEQQVDGVSEGGKVEEVAQGPMPAERQTDGATELGQVEEVARGPMPAERQTDGATEHGRVEEVARGPALAEQQMDCGIEAGQIEEVAQRPLLAEQIDVVSEGGEVEEDPEPETSMQEDATAEASQPTEHTAAEPVLGRQQADGPCEGGEVEVDNSQEDDAAASSQPAVSSTQGASSGAKRHSYGLKAVKVDEWIREAARRYKARPPQRHENLQKRTDLRREHTDANILEVFKQRAIKAGLGAFLRCKLRRLRWGDAELEAWAALASKEAQEQPQNLDPVEEPGEEDEAAGAERRAKAEEDEPSSKAWAAAHTVRRLGERWPSKRPCQRWTELKQAKKTGEACEEAREEHDAAVTLKVMRYQFLEGALPDATFHELLRLPECWALDMVLTWQAHLMIKLGQIADAFPSEMPSREQLNEDSEPARWVREYRRQACRCGLSPHLAAEFKAWLPWGAEALSQWLPQQLPDTGPRCKRPLASERGQPLERLRQLVIKYPTAPPTKRMYVSSEEERDEQIYASYLERVCKWHFLGIVNSEALLAVVGDTPWLSELLVEWDRNKSEGKDPEEVATIQRLQEIGERHPLLPPTQAAALERERWSWPHELRVRHCDAWFLRVLKDKFFQHGFSEAVENAMRAIPTWGAPRLEEWRVQKDQRAQQIFERQHRTWKKKTELGQGGDGAEDGEDGEGEASHNPPRFKRRIPPPTLRDSDRLLRTGKEPRCHVSRVRVDRCHGKTVGEAIASVRTGVLRLTHKIIVQDIMGGLLRLERSGAEEGIASALGATVGPSTPSRAPSAARPLVSVQKRSREERYRSLTGKVVSVERPSNRPNRPKELTDLKDLTPGEIDQFMTEDLYHYERQLGWSSKRAYAERLKKLSKELQVNTLPWAAPSTPAPAEEGPEEWPANFAELTAYQRLQLKGKELQHFEQQGLIADGKDLSLQERRERLKELVWKRTEAEGAATAKKEQVFMKQWQATAATAKTAVTTIEDDDDE